MATKKQQRRREKLQRHEYVYVDEEGNEVEPPKAKPADSFSDDAEPPLKETIEELEKSITGMFRRKTG
jgi:hypothetical protein